MFPNCGLEDLTLVISPLISLMKDQVDSLTTNGINAAFFNSSQSDFEKREILNACMAGEIKLLYISPESLVMAFDNWLKSLKISLIAIDEAHCVSMWGHDFRPEYGQIKNLRAFLGKTPFMALTATADKITRRDITKQLGLNEPEIFLSSFNRPNLSLAVKGHVPKKNKVTEIINFIKNKPDEAGIIYSLSRKETEQWSETLNNAGISSRFYHAGLNPETRAQVQDGFINDNYQIICATVAFGMGIDKSNVRWIIHTNLPKNIEGYYQEIGRAGRDGMPADTLLFYNFRDIILLNDFIKDSPFKDTYVEKINRMVNYAEATSCRRNILLSYFGEFNDTKCNNCDICENPPEIIDGLTQAQMALSGILRTNQQVGVNMLINILRGAKTMDIFEKKYNEIKTYGVGSNYSFYDWQHYINQMINYGYLEIAYDDHLKLVVTDVGRNLLKPDAEISLSRPPEKKSKAVKQTAKKQKAVAPKNDLTQALKKYRKEIAQKNSVPAYVIFNDSTLNEIVTQKPNNHKLLLDIPGMGKVKVERFGDDILKIVNDLNSIVDLDKLPSHIQTFKLYEKKLDIQEISQKRDLSENTIYGHLSKLYEEGYDVNLHKFVSEYEVNQVKEVRRKLKSKHQLKPVHDALEGQLNYTQIGLALTIISKIEQDN